MKSCAIRLISTSILGRTGHRTIYVLAAVLNLIMAVIVYRNIPDVEPKTKASYKDVLKGMLTAFARYRVLPLILLQTGMAFGITFNLFWTGMTFLLSGAPFHYNTFQIGLLSLVGLAGAAGGMGIGKLQDKGLGIPALGVFITLDGLCMLAGVFFGKSIVAIAFIL